MATKKKTPQVVIHTEEVYMAIEEDGALTLIEWIPNENAPAKKGRGVVELDTAFESAEKIGEGVI